MRLILALLFSLPAFAQEVYFSPNGGAQEAVVKQIEAAKTNIFVQAYGFTNIPIATALVDAAKRGVKIAVLLDKSNRHEKHSEARLVSSAGIQTEIDGAHAIAHNKVMLIDGQVVITGSYNFTSAAERHNAENLLILHDAKLYESYLANWQHHEAHSQAYSAR